MGMRLMAPLALLALVPATALAGGRAAETCVNAGYRAGTAAFDTCVVRMSGDDPLSALEGGQLSAYGDGKPDRPAGEASPLAAMSPARAVSPTAVLPQRSPPPEMPASFNTPTVLEPARPPNLPGGGDPPASPAGWWPMAPTPPTMPSVTMPGGWTFNGE